MGWGVGAALRSFESIMRRVAYPQQPLTSITLVLAATAALAACGSQVPEGDSESLGTAQQAFEKSETEPNDTSAFSDRVKAVDMVTATLPVNDADTYVLAARPGDLLFAVVDTGDNLALDTELSIFSDQSLSNAIEFDDNDGQNASSVLAGTEIPPGNQSFVYLRAVNGGPTVGGTYRLQSYLAAPEDVQTEAEGNDEIATANPIVNSRVSGQLSLGDVDYIAFEARAGAHMAVIVDNDPAEDGNVGTQLTLVDGNDAMLALGNNALGADGNAVFATAGSTATYYARIAAPISTPDGEYDVVILVDGRPPESVVLPAYQESGNNAAAANADSLKGQHPGEGAVSANSSDFWRLLSEPGDRLYAYVDTQHSSPSPDATLTLTDQDDNPIETDLDDGPQNSAVVAGAVSSTQSTFLQITEASDGAIGDYHVFAAAFDPSDIEVQVILNDNMTLATARPLVNPRNRAIATMDDVDYYAFDARSGETVVVIVDEEHNDTGQYIDTSLSIRDASDQVLAQGDDGHGADEDPANAAGPVLITADGTYYVRVANDDETSATSASYEMVVLRSSGPIVCGDGDLDGSETCDDANGAAGDGCGVDCAVEPGFTCSGEPSVCNGDPGAGGAAGTGGGGTGGDDPTSNGSGAGNGTNGGSNDDGGGCSYLSRRSNSGAAWMLVGLALAAVGLRRRRGPLS